jgi:hypothetical protein
MKMQEQIMNESPRRRIARRVGAAGMSLAAVLVLAGCHEAYGGGYIGDPVDPVPVGTFNGDAKFGFNFQCDDGVKGQITYHDTSTKGAFPGLRLHGTVDKVLIDGVPADTCEEIVEAQAAHFEGSYRSLERRYASKPRGRFNVFVFDQGEPSRPRGDFTGDGFSIELHGVPNVVPYAGYTRAGNIEGGNIQAE